MFHSLITRPHTCHNTVKVTHQLPSSKFLRVRSQTLSTSFPSWSLQIISVHISNTGNSVPNSSTLRLESKFNSVWPRNFRFFIEEDLSVHAFFLETDVKTCIFDYCLKSHAAKPYVSWTRARLTTTTRNTQHSHVITNICMHTSRRYGMITPRPKNLCRGEGRGGWERERWDLLTLTCSDAEYRRNSFMKDKCCKRAGGVGKHVRLLAISTTCWWVLCFGRSPQPENGEEVVRRQCGGEVLLSWKK